MKKIFFNCMSVLTFIAIGLCIPSNIFPQVTIGSKYAPNLGSILDLKQDEKTDGSANSTKGLGLPRVALTAVDKLEPCVTTNDTNKKNHIGLTVFNTTDNSSTDDTLTEGVYAWDGDTWTKYTGGSNVTMSAENGITVSDKTIMLGGSLNKPTTISGNSTNTLTLAAPTTIDQTLHVTGATILDSDVTLNGTTILKNANIGGDITVVGNTKTGTATITGNETVGGTLAVTGATTLNTTTINVENAGESFIINDGKASKAGKYLKAMDNTGKAEWQALGTVSTTPPVSFGTGISYDPTTNSEYPTNTTIALPPGRWLVQCAFLFVVQEVSKINETAANQASPAFYSHWVQIRMYDPSGYQATSSLVSGNINKTSKYNMLTGYFVVTNSSTQNITYNFKLRPSSLEGYIWPTNSLVDCFNKQNGENTVIAFSLTE